MRDLTQSLWEADQSSPVLELTVGELLRQAAADVPDKLAVVSVGPGREDRTWTYAELLDDAERAAAWLLERFEPGEHVAVWAPNVPEWLVLQYGVALAGLVLVAVNPALRDAELAYALQRAECVGIFAVGEFRGTDMAAMVERVCADTPEIRESVDLNGWLTRVRDTVPRAELPVVTADAPTQIQFTSGTTGRPKAAVLAHRAMVSNAAFVRDRCGLEPGATYATALPLFHTAGCGLAAMGSFYDRATLVLAEIFDPGTVLKGMADHRAAAFGGVPLMLHALLAFPGRADYDLSALKVMMSGGDAVPAALVDGWAQAYGVASSAVYGQTEASPIICQTSPTDDREAALHTAGLPLPNVDVAIIDPGTGDVVPIGTEGEICARGYQVMLGYLGQPDETARTVDADGWLHTGDLGTMDARGYVTVTGRLKDLIIRGGENIYPREVEEALVAHPAVANAAVLGRRDEAWGEQVVAVVTLDPAQEAPSSDDLHAHVRGLLAPHKTPRDWFVVTELPVNAMGKLQKFRLRDGIEAGELRPL
ncbi:AMP-binding protein [Gordonia alkaliphila]|uniref:class I adenylate-forming enzyme family protein n=1 Tax=Gordonia alkaliphila TaxID=1053547 RepID=UPI001FF36C78|nr:AMP-binding protein [Gordonia alkaliphila]MCK0439309.1 AMP-binding protein [Gordonia alkaliphila]